MKTSPKLRALLAVLVVLSGCATDPPGGRITPLEFIGWLVVGVIAAWIVSRDARNRDEQFPVREPGPGIAGSTADPRVERMVTKQKAYGRRLRKRGLSMLSGKEYVPELTKKPD